MQTCCSAFSELKCRERCLGLTLITRTAAGSCVQGLGRAFCDKDPPSSDSATTLMRRLNSLTLYTPHCPELRKQQHILMMKHAKTILGYQLFMDRIL